LKEREEEEREEEEEEEKKKKREEKKKKKEKHGRRLEGIKLDMELAREFRGDPETLERLRERYGLQDLKLF
jgi:hypothetical protein